MPEVMKRAKQQKLCLMYVIDEKCIRRNQVAAFAAGAGFYAYDVSEDVLIVS